MLHKSQNMSPTKALLIGAVLTAGICGPTYAQRMHMNTDSGSLVIKAEAPDGTWHWISSAGSVGSRVVWVGQKIKLGMKFSDGIAADEPVWAVPGNIYKDYDDSGLPVVVQKVSASDLNQDTIIYRYCDRLEGSVENRVSAKAKTPNGSLKYQFVSYRSRKPQATVYALINDGPNFHGMVHAINGPPQWGISHPGIKIYGDKVGEWPSGRLKWVQKIISYNNNYYDGNGNHIPSMEAHLAGMLDHSNPYPEHWIRGEDPVSNIPSQSNITTQDAYMEDIPAAMVSSLFTYAGSTDPAFDKVSTDHHFCSYLMFKTNNISSTWVPLSYVNWRWAGTGKVVYQDPHEIKLESDPYGRTIYPVHEAGTVGEFPEWTAVKNH